MPHFERPRRRIRAVNRDEFSGVSLLTSDQQQLVAEGDGAVEEPVDGHVLQMIPGSIFIDLTSRGVASHYLVGDQVRR